MLAGLRAKMRREYDRHVPTGTLLNDRWELAKSLGFGEGSSIYDESLVFGRVSVGRHCWIGPFTILDGAHAELKIGDSTSIGAGSHIYTHDTIVRTLTGTDRKPDARPTTIGSCCFIAPHVVIGPRTTLGDHCFVAAGAYVQGRFPDYSFIRGNPAIRAGRVVIEADTVRIAMDK